MQPLTIVTLVIVVIAVVVFLFRAVIYDAIISGMTAAWYKAVLDRLPSKAYVLDVGIGTGKALLKNKDIIKAKQLKVLGVDYDADYVKRCETLVNEDGMKDYVQAIHASIYDYSPEGSNPRVFDAVYFSGSLMIMPDPVEALKKVAGMLKGSSGLIYITQTFEEKPNKILEYLKPMLKYLTTIDFGRVTYEYDFLTAVGKAGLRIQERTEISPSSMISGVAANKGRVFKLYVLAPRGDGSSSSSSSTSASSTIPSTSSGSSSSSSSFSGSGSAPKLRPHAKLLKQSSKVE